MNYSKNALKGVGVLGIIGFEMRKHINLECDLHYRSQQDGASDIGISFLIGVLGY